MRDDVQWGDVGSEDEESLLTLAKGFDDFFDTTLELTSL